MNGNILVQLQFAKALGEESIVQLVLSLIETAYPSPLLFLCDDARKRLSLHCMPPNPDSGTYSNFSILPDNTVCALPQAYECNSSLRHIQPNLTILQKNHQQCIEIHLFALV